LAGRSELSVRAAAQDLDRPVLELSGTKLRVALENVLAGCEGQGGVEHYIDALKLKSRMFQQALLEGDPGDLDIDTLAGLCTFMATVRRRIAPYLTSDGIERIRGALKPLLEDLPNTSTADDRLAAFTANFAVNREHRWVHDFAAEVLHNVAPEHYPLMTRWVWHARANTGALREIWFGDDVDYITIPVGDRFETFLMLREELAVFLSDNGFFRDIIFYIDLLQAHIYAEYICAQGGTYLRADFTAPEDPMQHARRMLGLDGVKAGSAKTRLKTVDGDAFVLDETGE
jgi:hypothetical protein